jgi:hypothetical protein
MEKNSSTPALLLIVTRLVWGVRQPVLEDALDVPAGQTGRGGQWRYVPSVVGKDKGHLKKLAASLRA